MLKDLFREIWRDPQLMFLFLAVIALTGVAVFYIAQWLFMGAFFWDSAIHGFAILAVLSAGVTWSLVRFNRMRKSPWDI